MPLNGPCSPDSLGPSNKSKTYATVGTGIAITADGGGPSRRIRVAGAGNINIDYGNGVTDIISSLVAGESLDVQAVAVLAASTTATGITIFW